MWREGCEEERTHGREETLSGGERIHEEEKNDAWRRENITQREITHGEESNDT